MELLEKLWTDLAEIFELIPWDWDKWIKFREPLSMGRIPMGLNVVPLNVLRSSSSM